MRVHSGGLRSRYFLEVKSVKGRRKEVFEEPSQALRTSPTDLNILILASVCFGRFRRRGLNGGKFRRRGLDGGTFRRRGLDGGSVSEGWALRLKDLSTVSLIAVEGVSSDSFSWWPGRGLSPESLPWWMDFYPSEPWAKINFLP